MMSIYNLVTVELPNTESEILLVFGNTTCHN